MKYCICTCPPGFLCPVAVLSNTLLLLEEDDSPHRRTLCTVLIMSRLSIAYFYFNVFLFSFQFRLFLVMYADRGLIKNGRLNLGLFGQLFWVVVASFIVLSFALVHGRNLLEGQFLVQNMNRERACLLGNTPEHSSKIQSKGKAIVYALVAISFVRLVQFKIRGKRFISGLCPNGRMSCLGNFRRNVINLDQTFLWFLWWCLAGTFCCFSLDYGDGYFSVKTQFWIWNFSSFISYEGLNLVIPFFLCVPSQGKKVTPSTEFYVRNPILEPRIPRCFSEKVNTTVCHPISAKGYKSKEAFSRKALVVQELQEIGVLSMNPRDIRAEREVLEEMGETFSQFQRVPVGVYGVRTDFEGIPGYSKRLM